MYLYIYLIIFLAVAIEMLQFIHAFSSRSIVVLYLPNTFFEKKRLHIGMGMNNFILQKSPLSLWDLKYEPR